MLSKCESYIKPLGPLIWRFTRLFRLEYVLLTILDRHCKQMPVKGRLVGCFKIMQSNMQ